MQSIGNTLASGLAEELSVAASLLEVLKREQERLINADADALPGITDEKAKIIARMSELAHSRHCALATAGFDASEQGMQKWVDASGSQTPAGKSWNALLDLVRQGKELNRTNGLLIGQHMARNQVVLNVLQGAPEGGTMYGPNGQSTTQTSSRKLVVG